MKKRWIVLCTSLAAVFIMGMIPIKAQAACSNEQYNSVSVGMVSETDPYEGLSKISLQNLFYQSNEDYYVYFYMIRCPYCNLVKEEMIRFASSNDNVYLVDYALAENRPLLKYDWNAVRNKYNKKIGTIDNAGNIIYLPGESEEKYKDVKNDFGKVMQFQYVVITQQNITSFSGASIGDVYIDVQTPEINYNGIRRYEDMVIAGVPTLLHVKNGIIDEFYFDATEIEGFLKGK